MDETALLRFLLDASRRGYAAGRSAVKVQEADHSTTIVLAHGKWKFHHNSYGGREGVFLEGRPVWIAVYYGWVEGANADPERVYAFLQRALREAPAEFPVRGPDEFSGGPPTYGNAQRG